MKVSEFLKIKNHPIQTIGLDETVQAAIQKLVEHNIGALPVCDTKGMLLGIVSERDLLRECSRGGRAGSLKVKDVMTRHVVIAVPEDNLDYVMSMMTRQGIRHLPIMVGAKLEGIISIRDVVEMQLHESKLQVRYLSDYISGGYH